jgi:predicted RNA methylase
MFEIRVFDPVEIVQKTVLAISHGDEKTALAEARRFLISNGIKIADFHRHGSDDRPLTVFGFEDQESSAAALGAHRSIVNSAYFIFEYIHDKLRVKVDSFIDMGCGAGNILLCAHSVFGAVKLAGVEIDQLLLAQARENTAAIGAQIIAADMLEWAPENNDFDMVYFYEPFASEDARQRFLSHLAAWLRDGQYVYYQHTDGDLPRWLTEIKIPNVHPCFFTFDKRRL